MDVLIVEPLDADVLHWLGARHAVHFAPELAQDPGRLSRRLVQCAGADHPALGAGGCQRAATRAASAGGGPAVGGRREHRPGRLRPRRRRGRAPDQCQRQAEAEFIIGALLQMLRRVPVLNGEGLLVGRELGGTTVGWRA
jgi:D-3-phosphoglycerate dehydrogenase